MDGTTAKGRRTRRTRRKYNTAVECQTLSRPSMGSNHISAVLKIGHFHPLHIAPVHSAV